MQERCEDWTDKERKEQQMKDHEVELVNPAENEDYKIVKDKDRDISDAGYIGEGGKIEVPKKYI
jgi:hypothetical protein